MNAVPPSMTPGHASDRAVGASSTKWAALHDAGDVVAVLAGLEPEQRAPEVRNFPALMREAPEWRRALAERGIDEMAAVMEAGIAALLGVNAGGADPRPAALALWHEFTAARGAMLDLLPHAGAMGPSSAA